MNKTNHSVALKTEGIIKALESEVARQCNRQNMSYIPLIRQQALIEQAAAKIAVEFVKGYKPSQPGAGVTQWLESDDIDASSLFMAEILFDCPVVPPAVPTTVEAFSCCAGLLLAATPEEKEQGETKTKWSMLAKTSVNWSRIILEWKELEELRAAGSWASLNQRLKRIVAAK